MSRQSCPILVAMCVIGAGALLGPLRRPPIPRLIWNGSASAALGLYYLIPGRAVSRGDMVLAEAPSAARALAARRHYLPADVPLVKRVAALAGDTVCSHGLTITIDGRIVAQRWRTDSQGRPLPYWRGCRLLGLHQVFLLMAKVPDSFDGRYFGAISTKAIIGRLLPLWTW